MNSVLWNSGREEDKQIARDRKRRLHYISNVLVISDPENPQNEGQVKLYRFGKKIFDKIMDVMQPQFADEDPVNPYDFWEGADFKIKIRKVEGWTNYDKSEFSKSTSLYNGDEGQLEEVYNRLYSLNEFTSAENYKSYDELKMKLNRVLGVDAGEVAEAPEVHYADVPSAGNVAESPMDSAPVEEKEDDTLSYFAKLAQEN